MPGQSVLILGNGIAGLLHIALARASGAGLIIASDTIPFRMEMAEEMGAHRTFMADNNLPETIREINDGYLADIVIICHGEFIPLAFSSVEKGGTLLFFASAPEDAVIQSTVNDLFWRTEMTLTSSYAGAPSDCSVALKLINAGVIPVNRLITHRLKLADTIKGFNAVCSPIEHNSIKVIVNPQE